MRAGLVASLALLVALLAPAFLGPGSAYLGSLWALRRWLCIAGLVWLPTLHQVIRLPLLLPPRRPTSRRRLARVAPRVSAYARLRTPTRSVSQGPGASAWWTRGLVLALGIAAGEWVARRFLYPDLALSRDFRRLAHTSVTCASWVFESLRWSLRLGLPLAALRMSAFVEAEAVARRRVRRPLEAAPSDPSGERGPLPHEDRRGAAASPGTPQLRQSPPATPHLRPRRGGLPAVSSRSTRRFGRGGSGWD